MNLKHLNDMCITCSNMIAGGDMAPRLWKCTNGEVKGMAGTMALVKQMAKKLNISENEAGRRALDFLIFKENEFEAKGDIYFCEDHFNEDLFKKFLATRMQKLGLKKIDINIPSDQYHNEFDFKYK